MNELIEVLRDIDSILFMNCAALVAIFLTLLFKKPWRKKVMANPAGYFVIIENTLGRYERVNVQHITWLYYDDKNNNTVVRFWNGNTRYYPGNVIGKLMQDCIVNA